MTSSFSLNPVAVEAAAKAIDDRAFVDEPASRAEAAIRAFLTAEGARVERQKSTSGRRERTVTAWSEWREL